MTLVVAAPGSDFIILGADSRGTIEDAGHTKVQVNIVNKIIQISKYAAIMLYGTDNESRNLVHRFQASLHRNDEGVTDVANNFASFCRDEARLLADVPRVEIPDIRFIIAGLDKEGRKCTPKAYSLRSFNGYWLGLYPHFAIEGKPMIALYLFSTYHRDDMTLDDLCKLITVVINETRKIDGDVGGRTKLAAIDCDGYREVSNEDIREYLIDWEKTGLKRNIGATDQVLTDDETMS